MSSPANRTALRGGEPARPAQPAAQRQRGDGPDPVQPRVQLPGAGQLPGRVQQPAAHRVQVALQRCSHLQGHRDLQLPGRRQPGRGRPQRGQALAGAQRARRAAARPGGTVPRGSAAPRQCARPAGRDTAPAAPGIPGCARAGSSTPAAARRPAAAAGAGSRSCRSWRAACGLAARGVGRLGDMRGDPGRGQLLCDVPPPGAPLHREVRVLAGEPARQPRGQVLTVGRGDLAAPHLPRGGVGRVAGARCRAPAP